jgi:hypothetical protein
MQQNARKLRKGRNGRINNKKLFDPLATECTETAEKAERADQQQEVV